MRCLAFIVLLSTILLGNFSAVLASDWQLVKNRVGIKVYTRAVEGSGYKAFKGITRINTSFDNLLAVMADTGSNCKWMHQCGNSTILKQVSFTERYIYQVNFLPAPLWNRDIIMHSVATANRSGDVVTIRLKAAPHYCDRHKSRSCRNLDQHDAGKNYVRIEKAHGFFRLRKLSEKLVEVTWQMHAEPGGEVLGWMANLNLVEIPFNTLRGLKSYVKLRGKAKSRLKLAQR